MLQPAGEDMPHHANRCRTETKIRKWLGVFLDPRRACWINEEEVPKMGVRLEM